VLSSTPRCPWPDLMSRVELFRDQAGETPPVNVQRPLAAGPSAGHHFTRLKALHLAIISLNSCLLVAFKAKGCFWC